MWFCLFQIKKNVRCVCGGRMAVKKQGTSQTQFSLHDTHTSRCMVMCLSATYITLATFDNSSNNKDKTIYENTHTTHADTYTTTFSAIHTHTP